MLGEGEEKNGEPQEGPFIFGEEIPWEEEEGEGEGERLGDNNEW